jgi:hypothetical protein
MVIASYPPESSRISGSLPWDVMKGSDWLVGILREEMANSFVSFI